MTQYQTIEFERTGAIARITLNRPTAANGIDHVLGQELAQIASLCADDPALKVVTLTGAGRFFSAGGDLKAMAAQDGGAGAYVKGLAHDLHEAISSFARMDALLIVAVNGTAAGAGFSLAVTGDLVLAAESASFTMAYTRAGLSPDGGASYYLPRLIGLRRTQELMLFNRTLTAAEALDWGLLHRVVPDAQLSAAVDELAAQFAAGRATPMPTSRSCCWSAPITPSRNSSRARPPSSPRPPTTRTARRASPRSWASGPRSSNSR